MKNQVKKTETVKEKMLKKDLLKFVMGGYMENDRCDAAGSKYADSIYVKPQEPVKPRL